MLNRVDLHHEMTWRLMRGAWRESVVTSSVILIIIGSASVLGYALNGLDTVALWPTRAFAGGATRAGLRRAGIVTCRFAISFVPAISLTLPALMCRQGPVRLQEK